MPIYSIRAMKALEVLKAGGYIAVGSAQGFHGQPIIAYTLYDRNKKRVKGFGLQTLREIEPELDKKQDKFGFDYGIYRMAAQ